MATNEAPLVEFNETGNQYAQGYRYVWRKQFSKSYVFKDIRKATWGSGVYELNADNNIGNCVDWNFDSSD